MSVATPTIGAMPELDDTTDHLFECEVCDTILVASDKAAFDAGWDYPPFIGSFGVLSPRTCGNCPMVETAYWAVVTGTPADQLSERHRRSVARIANEQTKPEGDGPRARE